MHDEHIVACGDPEIGIAAACDCTNKLSKGKRYVTLIITKYRVVAIIVTLHPRPLGEWRVTIIATKFIPVPILHLSSREIFPSAMLAMELV